MQLDKIVARPDRCTLGGLEAALAHRQRDHISAALLTAPPQEPILMAPRHRM